MRCKIRKGAKPVDYLSLQNITHSEENTRSFKKVNQEQKMDVLEQKQHNILQIDLIMRHQM